MEKKVYQIPFMSEITTVIPTPLAGTVKEVADGGSGTGIGYGGGGSGPAYVKGRFGDLWEETDVENAVEIRED